MDVMFSFTLRLSYRKWQRSNYLIGVYRTRCGGLNWILSKRLNFILFGVF